MESYLIYIGKAALAAGTFHLLYLALFQHQKQFVFNRIYLPVSLAISFLIPLITFTTVKYIEPIQSLPVNSFAYLPEATEFVQPEFVYQWYHYLTAIYLLGILGFFLHLLFGHSRAISIIRYSRLKELFGAQVNISGKDIHPFSFFNKIVLSEKTLDNPSLEIIVNHELIHVKERHTLDILFAEILFLFQWFNPFAWLIKDAMRNNLEYKTDDQIAQNNNAEAYQLAMVGLAHKKGVAPFLTALNGSQLKNRIIMMKKKTENKYALLKQLIVLPLLAVLVMGLSNKEVHTEFVQAKKEVKIVVDGVVIPSDHSALASINFAEGFDGGEVTKALGVEDNILFNSLSMDEESESWTYYLKTRDYVKGTNPEFEEMTSPLPVKETFENLEKLEKQLFALDGKILNDEEAKNLDNTTFESAIILSGDQATEKYGEVAKDVTVVDLKAGSSNVKVYSNTSLKEMIITGTVINTKGEPISAATIIIEGTTIGTITDLAGNYEIKVANENVFLLFSTLGYEYKRVLAAKEKIDVMLTPNNIDSNKISPYGFIIKDKHQVSGKVTTKDGKPISGATIFVVGKSIKTITNSRGKFSIELDNEKESLVFMKDGFDAIKKKVDGISEITVQLKANENAPSELTTMVLYGDPALSKGNSQKKASLKNSVQIQVGGDPLNQPLYVVDGKEIASTKNLDPNEIESISVLKGESASALYGERGKNGVVLINTKASGVKGHVHKIEDKPEIKVNNYVKPTTVDSHVEASKTVFLQSENGENQPLCIVDGKAAATIENLDPNNIESVTVLKDESATALYGELGKNGVLLITTKEAAKKKDVVVVGYGTKADAIKRVGFEINESFRNVGNPLYIVDGKKVENLAELQPDDIESVAVIKDASAALYGSDAKGGVMLITTKSAANRFNSTITTKLELRKFISEKIRYPAAAQKANKDGIVKLYVKVSKSGIIYSVSEEKAKDAVSVDEVVVVGYSTENPVATGYATKEEAQNLDLVVETKKVINQLPIIEVAEFQGKTISITVKFELQDNKTTEITTPLQLRKFIAQKIKYPEEARKNNVQGSTTILVEFDRNGNRIQTMEKSGKERISLDEIVVIGYKNKEDESISRDHQITKHIGDETSRVLNSISKVEIPEFKGKVVAITVKFVLQ